MLRLLIAVTSRPLRTRHSTRAANCSVALLLDTAMPDWTTVAVAGDTPARSWQSAQGTHTGRLRRGVLSVVKVIARPRDLPRSVGAYSYTGQIVLVRTCHASRADDDAAYRQPDNARRTNRQMFYHFFSAPSRSVALLLTDPFHPHFQRENMRQTRYASSPSASALIGFKGRRFFLPRIHLIHVSQLRFGTAASAS